MLQDGLAGAEGAGYAEGAALGHGEEGVDAAELGHQGLIRAQTLLVAADGLLYGPGKDHGQLFFLAAPVFQHRHGIADIVNALFPDGLDLPVVSLEAEGHHDQVGEQALGHAAHRITGGDGVTGLYPGGELPILIGDGVQVHAPLQEEAALFGKLGQGVLQAVEHLGQQARAQLYAHQLPGELHRVTYPDAARHFINLHTGCVAVDADDLALEPVIAHQDIAHFIFAHGAGKAGRYQVSVDSGHISCHFVHFDSPVSL